MKNLQRFFLGIKRFIKKEWKGEIIIKEKNKINKVYTNKGELLIFEEETNENINNIQYNEPTIVSHLEWKYFSKGDSYSKTIKKLIIDLIDEKNNHVSLYFIPYEETLIENAFEEKDKDSITIKDFIEDVLTHQYLDNNLVDFDLTSKPILKEEKIALKIFPDEFHNILKKMNGKNTHYEIISESPFSAIHYSRIVTILQILNLIKI